MNLMRKGMAGFSSVILITGDRNSGKTTLCLELLKLSRDLNLEVVGLISPKILNSDKNPKINCMNLENGESILFATWEPGWDIQNPNRQWKIIPKASEWGNHVLRNIKKADVLFVDELGYLELEQNKGWTEALTIIGKKSISLSIVVLRPALMKKALHRWKNAEIIPIDSRASYNEAFMGIQKVLRLIAQKK